MTISQNFPSVATSLNLDFANSQQLDPRITFSRPTTAAYYDANTTALAEQNLVTQSNNLSTATVFQLSLGTATTDPTGGTTAVPLIESSSTTVHSANFNSLLSTIAGGTYTFSAFFKTGTTGRYAGLAVVLSGNGGVWAGVTVDAALGIITTPSVYGSSFSSVSATITASTNGFYRVSLTFTTASATSVSTNLSISNVYPITTTGSSGGQSYTGDGTSNIIAWGLQAEQRSSVTAYNATTTTAITNYIPVLLTAPTNQARFDHDPVARTSLGLLIEQQSTNLLTYSSDYTQSVWTKLNSTVTATANIAPDGTQNAQLIIPSTASGGHNVYGLFTPSVSTAYTVTGYFKAGGYNFCTLYLNGTGLGAFSYFNLSTGALGTIGNAGTGSTPSATITSVGNGWYRCSLTQTSAATVGSCQVSYQANFADNQGTWTGNGYSGIYIWGAQLEALAFPTSYIPTVASQVTRSSDSASMTGTNFSSWFNNQQGSIFLNWAGNAGSGFVGPQGATISNGVSSAFVIGSTNASGAAIRAQIVTNGASISSGTINIGTNTVGSFGSSMLSWNSTTAQVAFNGASTSRALTSPVLPTVNALYLGWDPTYLGANLNGYIKKLAYYPVATTALQQQSLTGS